MFSHDHPRQEGSPIPDGLEVAAININQVLYYNVHIMFLPSISSVTYLQMARVKLLNFCTDATHWKRSANVHPPTTGAREAARLAACGKVRNYI